MRIRPYRPRGRFFKHATKSIVALDTAWPSANDTYWRCCLRAYLCAHKLKRARSYVVITRVGVAMGFLRQIRMSWLRALSNECRCWCWCCGPGRWRRCRCCQLAKRTGAGAGRVVVTGCPCWGVSALRVVCARGGDRALAPVLGAGRAHGGRAAALGAGSARGGDSGRRCGARRCSVLVRASDSDVITTTASDSEGRQTAACSSEGRPTAASDNEVPAVMGRMNLCTQHHTVLSLECSCVLVL